MDEQSKAIDEIMASVEEEARKIAGEPVSATDAAGRLLLYISVLKALGAEESIQSLVSIGLGIDISRGCVITNETAKKQWMM